MPRHFRVPDVDNEASQNVAEDEAPTQAPTNDANTAEEDPLAAAEARMRAIENAENAVNAAFQTGKADRAAITQAAHEEANKAADMVAEAMEADEFADEAMRLAVIAENMGDRDRTKAARKRAKDARKEAKHAHKAATKVAKGAYDSIKFSQPGKLGFMRLVQIVYALNIGSILFALVLTSRDTISYDSVTIVDWITIILQGVGFWFFVNYFKITKKYVIAVAAFGVVANICTSIATGTVSLFGLTLNIFWNAFLILYFSFSKRVDKVLVNDFSTYKPKMQAQAEIKRSGWPFVRNLIIYFIIFSILGHWMEAGMCQFIRLGWVQGEYDPTNTMLWRDWLYPYPMEGAAVVIIALVLYPLWQYLLKKFDKPIFAYVVSFFANALTCSIIEFSMGLIVNANHQLWDYSDMPGNIMGQVCLQNAAAFGVAASLIAWFVYPMMERWIARVPRDTMNIVFVVVAVIGGILWSLYIIDPPQNHGSLSKEDLAAAQLKEEKDALNDLTAPLAFDVAALQQKLDDSKHLSNEDRDAIQKKIDELNTDLVEVSSAIEGDPMPAAA